MPYKGPPLKAVAVMTVSAALMLAAGAGLLSGRIQPLVADLPVREHPFHKYSSEFSPTAIQRAATARVGQYRFIGSSFLVRVEKMEKFTGLRWGTPVRVAENHELLRVRLTFEHPAGCAGFGATSTGIGVGVALAYRNGYDSERGGLAVVEGTCGVDPAQSLPPGWQSEGVCQFYYNRAWGPRYLVLSFIEDGVVLPQIKIPID